VVDIIIIYDQHKTTIEHVNETLNQLNPHLSFTHTPQVVNSIAFLDLTIHRCTHKLLLRYRKLTQTDTTIHFASNHPMQHQLAAHNFYIHRMLSLPITDQAQHSEWKMICSIAHSNAFLVRLLYNIRNKIIKKQHASLTTPHEQRKKTTFKSTNTIQHCLQNRPTTDKLHNIGIYRLRFNA
jgi:hypothetical protein